eukprot:1806827-Amphidinium_carterae.1
MSHQPPPLTGLDGIQAHLLWNCAALELSMCSSAWKGETCSRGDICYIVVYKANKSFRFFGKKG